MIREQVFPSPVRQGAKDHWRIADRLQDLISVTPNSHWKDASDRWRGGSLDECRDWTIKGDLSRVAASDALLSRYENLGFATPAWETISDVAGAVPDVPAYISGTPLTMRRRRRTHCETAPLTIIVDIIMSGGCSHEAIERRGAAILALVRLLTTVRPVALYAMVGGDIRSKDASFVIAPIDTAPLDLAHAAYVFTTTAAARGTFAPAYHDGNGGGWPYGTHRALTVVEMRAVCANVFPGELFCIPGLISSHPLAQDPEQWLDETLRLLSGNNAEAVTGEAAPVPVPVPVPVRTATRRRR